LPSIVDKDLSDHRKRGAINLELRKPIEAMVVPQRGEEQSRLKGI
jgi:hypothetical protein